MCSNTVFHTFVECLPTLILTTARLVVHQHVLGHAPGADHGTVTLATFQAVGRAGGALASVEFIVRVASTADHRPIVVLVDTRLAVGRTRCKAQYTMSRHHIRSKQSTLYCYVLNSAKLGFFRRLMVMRISYISGCIIDYFDNIQIIFNHAY